MVVFNGKLYFGASATDGVGSELRRYDPVTDTIELVEDIRPGVNGASPGQFIIYSGKLYFSAYNETYGQELFVMDNLENVQIAADVIPGSQGSYAGSFTIHDGNLYFQDDDEDDLWYFDGTTATRVDAFDDVPGGLSPNEAISFGGKLFFEGWQNANGRELWSYDGNKLRMEADLNPGSDDGVDGYFTEFQSTLYFSGASPASGGGDKLHYYQAPAPSPCCATPIALCNHLTVALDANGMACLLYTSPSPRDA